MGSDALRLWAASSDYTRDVTIGQPVLMSVNQALHKYRVTFKWLLGIFSLPSSPPTFTSFSELTAPEARSVNLADRLAMHRLAQVSQEVHASYARYEFFKGINTLNKYISNDLSAFYFETLKDRIYTGNKTDCQAIQRSLGRIFYSLLQMLAPVTPLLVEEVWAHVPSPLKENTPHPARTTWSPPSKAASPGKDFDVMEEMATAISSISGSINLAQERLRLAKEIGSSLESSVTLYLPIAATLPFIDAFTACIGPVEPSEIETQLASLFVVSDFRIRHPEAEGSVFETESPEECKTASRWTPHEESIAERQGQGWLSHGAQIVVHSPSGEKCPRCWRHVKRAEEEICGRCGDVLRSEGGQVAP
jgi:isoleucyl-tRNA synthetase